MTEGQFELIARYLRASGVSRKGCKLVLVKGLRQCDAARELDVDPTLIAVSLANYRRMNREINREFVEIL